MPPSPPPRTARGGGGVAIGAGKEEGGVVARAHECMRACGRAALARARGGGGLRRGLRSCEPRAAEQSIEMS